MKASYTTPSKTIKIPQMRLSWMHLALAVVVFLWFQSCNEKAALKSELSQIDKAINDTIQHFQTKEGEFASTRLALNGEKNSLEAYLRESRDSTKMVQNQFKRFKRVAAAVKTKTTTEIKQIKVPYVINGKEFDIPFEKSDQFYSLSGRSTNKGLTISNITIPNTQSIAIGDRKEGFFKTEFRIEVVNSNPYVKTQEVESFVFKQSKKRFGVGAFVGYGASSEGLSPLIGVGITYDLIRF